MPSSALRRVRPVLFWAGLALALGVPLAVAATSPLLQWRDAIYVGAGLAGVAALGLLLVQPLLAAGLLPGIGGYRSRRIHAGLGLVLVGLVIAHVAGLWVTSPPDVVDALTFSSPTPFSAWGVVAMWAVLLAALLASMRRRLPVGARHWRIAHALLAAVAVGGTVIHALLIEGTMGTASKAVLCGLAVAATAKAVLDLRVRTARQ